MIRNLSPFRIKEIMDSGEKIRLVDVREQWEYNIVKLPGSELMPLSDFGKYVHMLDPDEKIVVYCHHGVRSLRICSYLFNEGFKDVINLDGGINAWADKIDRAVTKY